jgi:hypothetical protein
MVDLFIGFGYRLLVLGYQLKLSMTSNDAGGANEGN